MFDQTFSLPDIPRLITLIFLEGILSVDNALALALIASRLPKAKRQKALFIGFSSAVLLRAGGILAAAYLIRFFWIQLIGGLYLLYLALSYFVIKRGKKTKERPPLSLWKGIILIELTDFAFAIDSILAGIALIGISFSPPKLPPKIWIVYVGGLAGIFLMRFAAKLFTHLLDRFKGLETGSHFAIGWIGLKLLTEAFSKAFAFSLPSWEPALFWGGLLFLLGIGFSFNKTPDVE